MYSGFPKPEGNTPIERKHWLEKHYNHYRTALMLEPRGHHDMFGSVHLRAHRSSGRLCRILHGYRRMAQHVRPLHHRRRHRAVETGMVEAKEPYTEVVLEAPQE